VSTLDFTALEQRLSGYREQTLERLLSELPHREADYLWELVPIYLRRGGKGLRSALCLATCRALGGSPDRALNTAAAIELLHNAFLVHDDAQDDSELRRGQPTLHREYGVAVAINVGNALNLLALRRLLKNHVLLGPHIAIELIRDVEEMLQRTLEGQALEVAWIRDNVCDLDYSDYYQLCLKKTAWYTTIFPCRAGAWIATGERHDARRLDRYAWYLGLAFQIQDDLLNLTGQLECYGKEIAGDLMEGKRTLILIHLLRSTRGRERKRVERFLGTPRQARSVKDAQWLLERMTNRKSLMFARSAARQLAGAAFAEALEALRDIPDSPDKSFLLQLPLFVIERNH
jgi:geranylgeranyl diphosphate synthase, type II